MDGTRPFPAFPDKLDGGPPAGKRSLRLWLRLLTCASVIERRISVLFREEFDTTLPRFDVSRLLMVTNGNITGLAARLKADGLIEACEGKGDRRAQYVRLTPQGASRFKTMAAAHERWIDSMLSGLAAEDAERLLELLDSAKRSLQRSTLEEDPS
jgi:DNA-binding MarR family transcriptional regulator